MNSKKKLLKFTFKLLVFLMPTQLALHFWPSWAHVFGIRVDYLAPTLYLTDILLAALLVVWIITAFKKTPDFQSGDELNADMSSFLRGNSALQSGEDVMTKRKKRYEIILGFSILLFALLNVVSAQVPEVAILKWLKVGELALFVAFVKQFKKLDINDLVVPISFSLILFSTIGIVQFLTGGSLGGLFYFLGERTFSATTSGISTVAIFGRQFLKAYSTFPHPNALAGYFLVSAIFMVGFAKKSARKLIAVSLVITALALVLTFSLGAAVALVFSLALFFVRKNLSTILFFIMLVLSIISPIFIQNLNISSGSFGSYSESFFRRAALIESAGKMIGEAPLLGVGLNNFIVKLPQAGSYPSVGWWLQPVHNIFLLVFSESGLLGLILFSTLIFFTLRSALKNQNRTLIICIMAILITGFFDHYWLTLQQNQLLFALILGLSLRAEKS